MALDDQRERDERETCVLKVHIRHECGNARECSDRKENDCDNETNSIHGVFAFLRALFVQGGYLPALHDLIYLRACYSR